MQSKVNLPLLCHDPEAPAAFTAEGLVRSLRETRRLEEVPVPPICVLDFDGDLTDWLVRHRFVETFEHWACFHTTMYSLEVEGIQCGIIARTIGGPYAVLIAEQLHISGARLILGLTSAGRVSPTLPLPSLVIPASAVRDEGTSFHYLAPSELVDAPTAVGDLLADELRPLGIPVAQGCVWTTDAPYRETEDELQKHANGGVLAVEMQTASLFAFAAASGARVGMVAHLTNAVDHHEEQFDKGTDEASFRLLKAMLRAGNRFLASQ